jgi:hypothetical protein
MTTRRLFVALFIIALFAMAVRETLDPDLWWHLRTGEFILQKGIPRQDIFSFTVNDHPWITHEWLAQLFMWLVYLAGGLPGLMVIFALLIAFAFGLVYLTCEGRPFLAAFVALLAAIASAIVWGARPQMFNLVLTAAFVYIIERYKAKRMDSRGLLLLPLLTILWANLHSGYLLGVVLLGTYTLGEALQRWLDKDDEQNLDWPAIRYLGLITLFAFLAAVLNPNGPELWLYPFYTLGSSAMQAYIQEWHSPDFHLAYFWPFALMLGLGVIGWLFSPKRPTWSELLLFFGTAAAGLLSARHIPLFAIVAAPIISRHLLDAFAGTAAHLLLSGPKPAMPPVKTMALFNGVILLLAVLAAGGWVVSKVGGNETAIMRRYPVAAVDFLEQAGLAEAPGYNSYNWGGYLIWRGFPVFVDGRADVYGDDFLFYYLKAFAAQEDWYLPLHDFDVQYVLMERGSPLAIILSVSAQWDEAYTDEIAQIFVRAENNK